MPRDVSFVVIKKEKESTSLNCSEKKTVVQVTKNEDVVPVGGMHAPHITSIPKK